jgi:IS5 family transposase
MLAIKKNQEQLSFYISFEEQLSGKHPLYILSHRIDWGKFEDAFKSLYCANNGRPAKAIRLMTGLLILKHIRNISDESVVEQWSENSYYQYFCGEPQFVAAPPCEASELVHFRKRIGEQGIELILKESIRINGNDSNENHVSIDSTVQEKNITFPTDAKLHRKIIKKCQQISKREGLPVRQSYTQTLKKLGIDQRFRNHPKNKGKARKADKRVKTIAGRLVRELERNLSGGSFYQNDLDLYKRYWHKTKRINIKSIPCTNQRCSASQKGKNIKNMSLETKYPLPTRKLPE